MFFCRYFFIPYIEGPYFASVASYTSYRVLVSRHILQMEAFWFDIFCTLHCYSVKFEKFSIKKIRQHPYQPLPMVIGTKKFTMSSARLKMRNYSYSVKNCSKQNFDRSIRFQLSFKTSCPSFKSIVAIIFKLLQFFCFLGSSKMRDKKKHVH